LGYAVGVRAYDAVFMEQAMALAEHGRGRTSPNPLVGAVIVDEGEEGAAAPIVLSGGYHERLGADHAEVAALRPLALRAPGKTLYVTLEPCNHVGRTGKCTDAILAAGIRRVVVGALDPNPRVTGGGVTRLRQAGIEVTVGVLAERCHHQNRGYRRWLHSGRPHMLMKAALSIDGKLALMATGENQTRAPLWLTGSAAQQQAHRLRDQYDAILVGAGTVLSDDPLLTTRLPASERRDERQPLRVVLDGALRTPLSSRLCGPGTLLITSEAECRARPSLVAEFRSRGVEILGLPPALNSSLQASSQTLDPAAVLRALGDRNLLYVMCEGGATLHGKLLSAELYDEAALFIAPLFLGERGVALGPGLRLDQLAAAPWLSEVRQEQLGSDVLLGGTLRYGGFAAKKES
jgi:diaminohydroxyphosphoribosylaminopyrimidine deaminase/5-amino-6-(5-phosphoribosylamino)uracil reductase